jgi:hypothetical protein
MKETDPICAFSINVRRETTYIKDISIISAYVVLSWVQHQKRCPFTEVANLL